MNKAEGHTLEPWALGAETDDERAQVIGADGSHICYVECDPVLGNAYLIIASPNLLAEAKELLRNARYEDGQAIVLTQDCEELQTAIAKAEGRE